MHMCAIAQEFQGDSSLVPRLSPASLQQMTFEPIVKIRKGRAWYVKSHDPKIRNFLIRLPELPCNVTRTCLADLLSSWDIYPFLDALASL